MNVSLRSQMVAGIAALGATAVAITPIAQPDLLPSAQRVSTDVQLSAFANPLTAIGGVIADINTDIFNQSFYTDDVAFWPPSFSDDYLYAPLNLGIIPDLANQFSTGPLVGLVNNLSGYAWAGVRSGIVLGGGVAASAFNAPFAVVTAVQQLIAGDPEAALDTLVTEIIGPLQLGVEGALAGVGYIVDNVIENFQLVTSSFLPFLAVGLFDSIVGGVTAIGEGLISTVTTAFAQLTAGNFEGAWNTAVNGLLGRDGTLGQIESMTLGIGLTATDEVGEFLAVPSPRAVITSELQRLGGAKVWGDGGITNDPFDPPVPGPTAATPAAAEEAPSLAALESAAPAEIESDAPKVVEADAPAAPADDVAPVADETAPAVDDSASTATESSPKPVQRAPRAAKADKADRSERIGRTAR
jgi:hypothetical protein